MKVLNLRCANGHAFEGWFASDDEFMDQNGSGRIECPMCADQVITRLPSAPRLNLSSGRDSHRDTGRETVARPDPADLQAAWLETVRQVVARTDDVGDRFAEEARRIHYGEEPARGIRGQATAQERAALQEEGIETMSIALPAALKGPVQ